MGLAALERIRGDAVLIQSPIHLLMVDGSSMRVMRMTPTIVMNIGGHQIEMNFTSMNYKTKAGALMKSGLVQFPVHK